MIIADSFKGLKNYIRHDGEVGLEIETETINPYAIPQMTYWSDHEDRSLRDFGVEYVLKAPVKVEHELPDALDEFAAKTKTINFKDNPVSASCHIHMNLLNENWQTFSNFLSLYVLFENLLIRYSGPNRLSNLFCLPVSDAEATATNIKSMMKAIDQKTYRNLFQMTEQHCKYAALNLAAFPRLGSLEVRSFRGSTDIKEIKEWVDIIYSIMQFSRQGINPPLILEEYKSKGLAFGSDVFGKNWKKLIPDEKLAEELVKKNLWYVQDSIAYAVSDWDNINEAPKLKKKPDAALLNKIAHTLFSMGFDQLTAARQEYVFLIALDQIETKVSNSLNSISSRDSTTTPALELIRNIRRASVNEPEPHPMDTVLVYRHRTDEEIEILRGDTEPDDELIETIQRAA